MDPLPHFRKKGDLLHPEREGETELAELERILGQRAFAAQYLQEPAPPDGAIIHTGWLQTYDSRSAREPGDEIVQSWDTASKTGLSNDYSVCTTWHVKDNAYYLWDVFRGRLEFPALRRKVIEHGDAWRADCVLIEDAASGLALNQDLKRSASGAMWQLVPIQPTADKIQRAEAQTVPIEDKRVYLPKIASWRAEFIDEIKNFPRGSHDDQVDSMTQFLAWIRARTSSKSIFEFDF